MNRLSMPKLTKLARQSTEGLPVYRLAVIGDCATQHISTAIRGTGVSRGVSIEVLDTDYDQILAQTGDPGSELFAFAPDGVFIMMCTEKLYDRFTHTPADARESFAETEFGWISDRWAELSAGRKLSILQSLFTEYDDRVFGSFASRLPSSFIYQLRRLNMLISDGAAKAKNVYPVDFSFFTQKYGTDTVKSSKLYAAAKFPFASPAIPMAAAAVTDIIFALMGRSVKCVVLDLDNTLWGGVVGDCGTDGIEIGDYGIGKAFTAFQTWLLELKKRGLLLAVCSKNDEDKAKDPFINHPDMVLKLEDFAIFVANWEPKPENIKLIRETLNIGMDSLVFIDDNPFERNSVREMLPEVTVPEMPADPADYVDFLRSEGLFEAVSFSAEDSGRTDMYRSEAGRVMAAKACGSYSEYLAGLEMKAEAKPFSSFWFPRIAQLSQRSNQFNLRTVRYTEGEIADIAADPDCVTLYFTLSDRFGDSGLISAVIMKKLDDETLFVDTWIMSCRVLKRTMEEFIVNKMISAAAAAGYRKVIGEYLKTPKNAMVADIYERLGFTRVSDNRFEADTGSFRFNESFITES